MRIVLDTNILVRANPNVSPQGLARDLLLTTLSHPHKKAPRRALCYLESAEVTALLSQPDRTSTEEQRDHALLSLLYNTGARIQEALNLRPQDLYLKSPAHVKLMGKGQKERISPIWPETAELISGVVASATMPPRWKRDADLLAWLDSL